MTSSTPHPPPPFYKPIFLDQSVRSLLLKQMPTLDGIDVIVRQVGDTSWGVQICDTDAAIGQDGMGATLGSGKGKEKELSIGPAPKACSRSLHPPREEEEDVLR
jgi:hypothetical protein